MNETVCHSGMDFITNNAFLIETSPQYTRLGENVKTVELIRSMGNKLLFIEAKSSFPNPGNPESIGSFREDIKEICDKFVHSLDLYAAIDIGVTDEGFPADYSTPDKVELQFVLVINGFDRSWCDEIERALTNRLRESISIKRIWKPEVFVMNDRAATRFNLTV